MPYSVPFITLAIAAYQRYQYYKMYVYVYCIPYWANPQRTGYTGAGKQKQQHINNSRTIS